MRIKSSLSRSSLSEVLQAAQVTRAKIALLANEHVRLRDIADELDVSHFTVSKWAKEIRPLWGEIAR
jgi:predicted transcriptional regulator